MCGASRLNLKDKNENMLKWIIGLIVIVAVGVFLWQGGYLTKQQPAPQQEQAAAAPQQQQAPQPPRTAGLPTADNDASDQALSQDTAAIDAQMQVVSADSTNVDGSLTDTPVPQAY